MKRKILSLSLSAFSTAIILTACTKIGPYMYRNADAPQNTSIYLTNDPGFYDSVFLYMQSVSVLVDTCAKDTDRYNINSGCGDWVSLNMTAGQYNVRALSNGVDTLLTAGTNLPAGVIKEIKIVLGTDSTDSGYNYISLNGAMQYLHFRNQDSSTTVFVPLADYKWQTSGLSNITWFSFELGQSIYAGIDSKLYVSPAVSQFVKNATSTLSGNIAPYNASPAVMIYNATDTAYVFPGFGGNFMVSHLIPGTYSAQVWSLLPNTTYNDTTLTNITTSAGNNTNIGSILLHH